MWFKVVIALLALGSCSRAEPSAVRLTPSASSSAIASESDSDRARLLDQIAKARAQGPVPVAALAQASVMILIDPAFRDPCLVYRVADVLQRAGYSVWPYYSHHLDGKYVRLYSSGDASKNEIALHGAFESEDISVTRRLEYGQSAANPDQRDVQFLAAELLKSPAFRSRVGRVAASESANQFVTEPIPVDQINALCSPGTSAK
jgi:hypothetical protein